MIWNMILTSLEKQPSCLQNALIGGVPMSQDYGMSFRLLQPQYEKPKSRGRQKVNSLFLNVLMCFNKFGKHVLALPEPVVRR